MDAQLTSTLWSTRNRRIVTVAVIAAVLIAIAGTVTLMSSRTSATTFDNPFIEQRADPHIFKHSDGYYYMTATVPEYDRLVMRRAETLAGLRDAPETTIWEAHDEGVMANHIWAPEIAVIDGKWYVYFAAGASYDQWEIRMYVLEGTGDNALTADWVERGQIATPWQSFSLDATTFEHQGVRYLVWAQNDPAIQSNTNLYIDTLVNPWTISGNPVMITTPDLDWERIGYAVNEGAAVIVRNGRVFMTYSASATDQNYAMGLLTADEDADLLDAASWAKSPTPVFTSNPETGQWGPGHNQFTVDANGNDVLVYHARSYQIIDGDPLDNPDRYTRLQRLYWNEDGTPLFGVPVPNGAFTFGDTPPSIFADADDA